MAACKRTGGSGCSSSLAESSRSGCCAEPRIVGVSALNDVLARPRELSMRNTTARDARGLGGKRAANVSLTSARSIDALHGLAAEEGAETTAEHDAVKGQ